MKKIIILFLISCTYSIIGGWEVSPECPSCKYPFNVSLQTYEYYILNELQPDLTTLWDGHFCQGTLIDNGWVLTNANCVDIVQNNMHIWVEIGLHNINDEISTEADSIAVNNIYFHPNYNSEEPWHYNYALLELADNSSYEPIKLISDVSYENIGNSVSVMGWGARSWAISWIHAYLLFENNSTIGQCLDGWADDTSLLCLNPFDIDDYDNWEMENLFEEGFPGGACNGDEGASLIVTNEIGEYELLGNYFLGCVLDYPHQNKFSRTYLAKDWIYSYIGYPDTDSDGISDEDDNCIDEPNHNQDNYDGDEQGDICDWDDDNDGVSDLYDPNDNNEFVCGDTDQDGCDDCSNGFNDPLNDGFDLDNDGQCNVGDIDDDNDGWIDIIDNCPEDSNQSQSDYDGDYLGDLCDFDDDNDGVVDVYDSNDYNEFICSDSDNDGCDDCSSGYFDLANDCIYINGDINLDGNLNIVDIVIMIQYVLNNEYNIVADSNSDGNLDVLDVVYFVNSILN